MDGNDAEPSSELLTQIKKLISVLLVSYKPDRGTRVYSTVDLSFSLFLSLFVCLFVDVFLLPAGDHQWARQLEEELEKRAKRLP